MESRCTKVLLQVPLVILLPWATLALNTKIQQITYLISYPIQMWV